MAKKQNVLLCWVGGNDLKAPSGSDVGPVLSTLKAESFDQVELLSSYPAAQVEPYLAWLREQVNSQINLSYESLRSPVHFGDIYQAANAHLKRLHAPGTQLSILLSPGTPAMQAVWILLGKVKTEFDKFGSVLEKTKQKIDQAGKELESAGVRSRAITRALRDVEALPADSDKQECLFELSDGDQ